MNTVESPYVQCSRFLLGDLRPDLKVLDLGCGDGRLLREIYALGCRDVKGIDPNDDLVATCRRKGFDVAYGYAEKLPFENDSFDAVVCSVVLPYTDERKAIAEISRVLKPDGFANITCHGTGYATNLLFHKGQWRTKLYALRMLLNTYYYSWTSRRLPGFLGDTLCQRPKMLRHYASDAGLQVEALEHITGRSGKSLFLAIRIRKSGRTEQNEKTKSHTAQ